MPQDFERELPRRVFREASPTEAIYIATDTIVVSRSTIAGTVSRRQFEQAVAALEARYAILRAVVEDGRFVERVGARPVVDDWLAADSIEAGALYRTLLNAALDVRQRIYSVRVVAGDGTLDVFLLTSHAVTDATSLVELHSYFANACDCVVRGIVPEAEEQPFPSPVDDAVASALAALPGGGSPAAALPAGPYAEFPMPAPYEVGPISHGFDQLVIGAEAMRRVHAASHEQGLSVHALLLAAFAVAIGRAAAGPRAILMRSSIDMRRRLEPHVSPELVFSAITGHATPVPDLGRPLSDIARLIFDDIHAGVANGRIFHDYLNYPKAFGSKAQAPVALNISDMQAVTFHWPLERLTVTGFEYALGWPKRFPNTSVSVFDGRLVANTAYVEQFVAAEIMAAISRDVVKLLLDASEG